MSIVNTLALESNRQIKINFYGGDLSSDAGLLLIKEFISKLGIDTLLEKAFKTNDPVFKSVLEKDALASQPTVSRFFNRMDEDTLNQFIAITRVLPVSYTHLDQASSALVRKSSRSSISAPSSYSHPSSLLTETTPSR